MKRIAFRLGLSLIAFAAAPAAAAPAAAEVSMVHDIPANHPRLPYFGRLAEAVAARSGGALTVAVNPGGLRYKGREALDAVRDGRVQTAWVNSAHLEALNPALGFVNLPFLLNDQTMAKPAAARAVVDQLRALAEPYGVTVLGLMRGADQLFVFKERRPQRPEDLDGVRVRVAGRGLYEEIMRRFGAVPVEIPIPDIDTAIQSGAVEGVFTSPGGWASQIGMAAPTGTLVPGLMVITYTVLANKSWFDALPAEQRAALLDAVEGNVTLKWDAMRVDDDRTIETLRAKGATLDTVSDTAPWRARVEPVAAAFRASHPDLVARLATAIKN